MTKQLQKAEKNLNKAYYNISGMQMQLGLGEMEILAELDKISKQIVSTVKKINKLKNKL